MRNAAVGILTAVLVAPLAAAPATVTLSVPGMNCALCPITVKKALTRVPGVLQADVDLAAKTATVRFDDARTTLRVLTDATRDAGYPSTAAAASGAKSP